MAKNAAASAYYDLVYKKNYADPISVMLSARRDLILHVQNKFKLNNLEVIYELDENEVFN